MIRLAILVTVLILIIVVYMSNVEAFRSRPYRYVSTDVNDVNLDKTGN